MHASSAHPAATSTTALPCDPGSVLEHALSAPGWDEPVRRLLDGIRRIEGAQGASLWILDAVRGQVRGTWASCGDHAWVDISRHRADASVDAPFGPSGALWLPDPGLLRVACRTSGGEFGWFEVATSHAPERNAPPAWAVLFSAILFRLARSLRESRRAGALHAVLDLLPRLLDEDSAEGLARAAAAGAREALDLPDCAALALTRSGRILSGYAASPEAGSRPLEMPVGELETGLGRPLDSLRHWVDLDSPLDDGRWRTAVPIRGTDRPYGILLCGSTDASALEAAALFGRSLGRILESFGRRPPIPARRCARVLVLDDEEPLRMLATEVLSHEGIETVAASDSDEAVAAWCQAAAEGRPFQAALLDLMDRTPSGTLAAEGILALDPSARLVACSGHAADPVLLDPERFGFQAALAKPYRLTDLVQLLSDPDVPHNGRIPPLAEAGRR